MDFGTRLKKIRKEKGFSQDEFAQKIGLSRSAVANYENGKNMPFADTLEKLADALDCSVDYLMGKTQTPEGISLDDIDVSFVTGVKGLNETNKLIIKNTIEALLAKQKIDDEKKEDK